MSTERFSLAGRHVLITGASSGLGSHLAGVAAAAGARVTLAARRVERLHERVETLRSEGHDATAVRMDVRDGECVRAGLDDAEAALGPVHVVVNNAGMEPGVYTYMTLAEADWDAVMETNLRGAWLVSREISLRWVDRASGGNLVNIASITAFRQQKGLTPYAVSKAGMVQLTRQMALEGARYGIRVNALAPGYFYSEVSSDLLDSELADAFVKGIPQRRTGELSDYDGAFLLLASEASAHMTGSVIAVDGGHMVRSL